MSSQIRDAFHEAYLHICYRFFHAGSAGRAPSAAHAATTAIDRSMLKRLKRWLGWDADSGLLDFSGLESRSRRAPPTVKPTPASMPKTAPSRSADHAAQRRAKPERTPLDALDNPRLTLDKPGDDGFDPYNTGAFNRSQSWERIGRQRKR